MPVDDALMIELEALAKADGKDSFREWVGSENYEMRVADDGSRDEIDWDLTREQLGRLLDQLDGA